MIVQNLKFKPKLFYFDNFLVATNRTIIQCY